MASLFFFGFQVWSTGGRSHKQCNGCGRFSVSSKLRKIRLIPLASEFQILTLAWNSEKTRREEKAENSRVKGGKLDACTRVCLCAHFVHKLTVVGVFISDVVECRQFRNQVSSQFNLKKLQYWLTWKRIHGAFGQGKLQHYRMVKKVIFFPCWFARLPWKLNAVCAVIFLRHQLSGRDFKRKKLVFLKKECKKYPSYMLRQDPRTDGYSICFSGWGGYQSAWG